MFDNYLTESEKTTLPQAIRKDGEYGTYISLAIAAETYGRPVALFRESFSSSAEPSETFIPIGC